MFPFWSSRTMQWASGWSTETADRIIIGGPAVLFGAVLTAGSGGPATAVLYEGNSTNDRTILPMSALASTSQPFMFPAPLFCQRGIYLDVGSNVTGVLVLWSPAQETPGDDAGA